jgi:hypothetical protein
MAMSRQDSQPVRKATERNNATNNIAVIGELKAEFSSAGD